MERFKLKNTKLIVTTLYDNKTQQEIYDFKIYEDAVFVCKFLNKIIEENQCEKDQNTTTEK